MSTLWHHTVQRHRSSAGRRSPNREHNSQHTMKAACIRGKSGLATLAAGIVAGLLHAGSVSAEVTLRTLVHFDWTNGYLPGNGLMEGRDGNKGIASLVQRCHIPAMST